MKKVSSMIVVFVLVGIFVWGISFNFQTAAIAGSMKLPDGTVVVVMTIEAINPKYLYPGDSLKFQVAEDVIINGITVIKKGTSARGEVVRAEKSSYVGKSGMIGIAVISTSSIDGQKIPLKGSLTREGESKTGTAAVASTVLMCPLPFLMKGETPQIPSGSQISAYVDNPVTITY